MKRLSRAFTLVELLVVVAIIALLLSILLPALTKAKEHVRVIHCSSGLRQIAIAQFTYASENRSRPAHSKLWINSGLTWTNAVRHHWHTRTRDGGAIDLIEDGLLYPYLNTRDIYVCPTFPQYQDLAGQNTGSHCNHTNVEAVYSYSMNSYIGDVSFARIPQSGGGTTPTNITLSLTLSGIDRASEVLLFTEENTWLNPVRNRNPLNDPDFRTVSQDPTPTWSDAIGSYHITTINAPNDGKGNVAFADGHTELVSPDDTGKYGHHWP